MSDAKTTFDSLFGGVVNGATSLLNTGVAWHQAQKTRRINLETKTASPLQFLSELIDDHKTLRITLATMLQDLSAEFKTRERAAMPGCTNDVRATLPQHHAILKQVDGPKDTLASLTVTLVRESAACAAAQKLTLYRAVLGALIGLGDEVYRLWKQRNALYVYPGRGYPVTHEGVEGAEQKDVVNERSRKKGKAREDEVERLKRQKAREETLRKERQEKKEERQQKGVKEERRRARRRA